MKRDLFGKVKAFLDDIRGKDKFGKLDFGTLKVVMMLAAVDGEVVADEIMHFRTLAEQCRGYNAESFENLWDAALHSAGYILLMSRLLPPKGLAGAFVCEAEKDFVQEVIQEVAADREQAFERLVAMASADGDYSEIERTCIEALAKRVKEARDQVIAERYPRATVCQ